MTLRRFSLVILAMTVPVYASSQSPLREGERIRVRAPASALAVMPNVVYERSRDGMVTGVVQSVSPSAIRVLQADGVERVIALDEVSLMERSLGRQRDFGRKFVTTVGTSALLVGTLVLVTWSDCDSCFFNFSRAESFALGLAGGAAYGVPIGIIIGLVAKTERWERLPLSGREHNAFSIQPVVGGAFGLSASFAFGGR